jgi:hypothetical protein
MVQYEVWSVESKTVVLRSSFHVPGSMVPFSYMYGKPGSTTAKHTLDFIFPTSLSSDLRHASFLNLVGSFVSVEVEEAQFHNPPRLKMQLQVVDIALKTDSALCGTFNCYDWTKFHRGFSTQISESGEYLLVLNMLLADEWPHIVGVDDITEAKAWFVRIYRNENFNT